MSKVLSLHHVVFGTARRMATIDPLSAEDLHRFIWRLLKEQQCYLCRINSMPDHVHMLIDLNPDISLSRLVSHIKSSTSQWMKRSGLFPLFTSWCGGYYASSISLEHKDSVIEYIKGQQAHHANKPYLDEMQSLYLKNGLLWHKHDLM